MESPLKINLAPYHTQAKSLMAQDRYLEAAFLLREGLASEQTASLYPRIDLASCYYMLADYVSFRRTSEQALLDYQELKCALSFEERAALALGLGRLLEELGMVAEALELYATPPDYVSSTRAKKLLAQQLRLKSELGLLEELRLAYLSCQQMLTEDGDQEVDFVNALLFAEHMLFGADASLKRYAHLHGVYRIRPSDQRLLFFNLLSLLLREGSPLPDGIYSFLESFDYFSCDPFEKGLYDLALTQGRKTPLEALGLDRCAQFSPMCAIRFISALAINSPETPLFQARREFMAYTDHLSAESKHLIVAAFPLPEAELQIHVSNQKVICSGVILDLGQSRNSLEILRLFGGKQSVSLEELCARVFASQLDESSQQRARMAVTRLNKALSPKLGLPALLQMKKTEIRLHDCVRIVGEAS